MKFSANLGFLWRELPLTDAIHAAARAGFAAVECHWPYDTPPGDVARALRETGLPMLGINTERGDVENGDNGLCALPGREAEAKAAIAQSVEYADAVDARAIHVMAGFSQGPDAHRVYVQNLRQACEMAGERAILIEPLNRHDAPDYFLSTTDQARAVIEEVAAPNLKLMFDCYHVGRTEGDVTTRLRDLLPIIGHIQFASVPHRGRPDQGELNYDAVFAVIDELGWDLPLGAEYKPGGATEDTLGWL